MIFWIPNEETMTNQREDIWRTSLVKSKNSHRTGSGNDSARSDSAAAEAAVEDEDTLQQNNLGTLHKDVALQVAVAVAAVGKDTHAAPVEKDTSRTAVAVASALRGTLVVVDKQMSSL